MPRSPDNGSVRLELREEMIVGGVRADPKPHDRISVARTHSSIADADSCGEDRRFVVYLFEPETRMGWILQEQAIRIPRLRWTCAGNAANSSRNRRVVREFIAGPGPTPRSVRRDTR